MLFRSIPVIRNFLELLYCERFSNSLSTLLESGISILHALDISGKVMGNRVYQFAIEEIREEVKGGKSLGTLLEKNQIFPVMLTQMIVVGEEVGELGKMLQRVSLFYREKIDVSILRMTTMVEPLILIVMGTIVGILVVSMFLPIFRISQIGTNYTN